MNRHNPDRRHDIDALRVIAIALLIVYHVAIGFQSWGLMIGFITHKESWNSLWVAMSLVNIWRIPLLFFVSGMGVFFALRKRNWLQLLKERSRRILLPFAFGVFFVVPVHILILQAYYSWHLSYQPNPSHLWFLANIFSYTLLSLPLFMWLKNNQQGRLASGLKRIFSSPLGLLIVVICFWAEAVIIRPNPYELYAMTLHGFMLGWLAFVFGFMFVKAGQPFWVMILKGRWVFLSLALLLYCYRISQGQVPVYLLSVESNVWVFTVFAYGYKYLTKPGRAWGYLSQAAYPVYMIHIIVLYGVAYFIFPIDLDVRLKFVLVTVLTLVVSMALYELIIRRIHMLRPLFGLKTRMNKPEIRYQLVKTR